MKALEQSRCNVSGRSASFRGKPLGVRRWRRGLQQVRVEASPSGQQGAWNHRALSSAEDVRRPAELSWASPPRPTAGSLLCPGIGEEDGIPGKKRGREAPVSGYVSLGATTVAEEEGKPDQPTPRPNSTIRLSGYHARAHNTVRDPPKCLLLKTEEKNKLLGQKVFLYKILIHS